MKRNLAIVCLLVAIVGIIAALSAVTYVQKEKTPDSESNPNRSTYNSGPTGTQAFFSLLIESGRNAIRWQQPPTALLTAKPKDRPSVFVVIGYTRRTFTKEESSALLEWVSAGGRLVLIDRSPDIQLLKTSSAWRIKAESDDDQDIFSIDPADQRQMTMNTAAARPVQPSIFTLGVNAVQTSRFAGRLLLERPQMTEDEETVTPYVRSTTRNVPAPAEHSPTVTIASGERNILIDAPYGEGRVLILSDPYTVSNGGIGLADNAVMAVNLVSAVDGAVAFDEYHQGYGADSNRLLQFFAGTPVVPIFLQGMVIIGFLFYSQSRRFGRPIPEAEPDRLSKLEYISAMAELQQRTRAYDLAMENIYTEFRRRAARAYGLDATTAKPHEIAMTLAGADGARTAELEDILFKCEEIIRGEPTTKHEVVQLIGKLRRIESSLRLTRAAARLV